MRRRIKSALSLASLSMARDSPAIGNDLGTIRCLILFSATPKKFIKKLFLLFYYRKGKKNRESFGYASSVRIASIWHAIKVKAKRVRVINRTPPKGSLTDFVVAANVELI